MKISIITWDASFRENFHTVDSFGQQEYPKDDYEFFWCDYYSAQNPVLIEKVNKYPQSSIVNLGNPVSEQWHLGKTINKGISQSKGDILIIPDGDIMVPKNFLSKVEEIFNSSSENLVVYFRRWDEPANKHGEESYTIDYLSDVCQLKNITNYGGGFAIRRNVFEDIGFYEEHEVFSGPGANGLEQYMRFRNRGLAIMWSDIKIYHPYHSFTGSSDKKNDKIIEAAKLHKWISPYMGMKQSWVIKERDQHLHWKANDNTINEYLKDLKPLEDYLPETNNNSSETKSFFKRVIKK